MSDDIITNLQKLSPEELAKVGNLINKFAKRKDEPEEEKEVDIVPVKGKKKPGKSVSGNPKAGRKEPKKPQGRGGNRNRQRGRKGAVARTEPVQLSGQNKFDQMKERNDFKRDAAIDKKLWQGREPTTRKDEYEPVEVQCIVCGLWYDEHPNLILVDPEEGTKYTCNNCLRK